MTTRRATPQQRVIQRIVIGAIRNARHAHSDWQIDPRFIRSIAKRAVGLLTAGASWPEVVSAESEPTDRAGARHPPPRRRGPRTTSRASAGKGAARVPTAGRPSVRKLRIAIGRLARNARHSGQTERHAALVDVLRLIGSPR